MFARVKYDWHSLTKTFGCLILTDKRKVHQMLPKPGTLTKGEG
jgi:hypothetical protein